MINLKKIDWFKTAILVFGVLFVLSWWSGRQQDKTDTAQLINALEDTVKVNIDKYGDKVSQISQIRTDRPQTFLTIKSNDAEIQRLQEEVKKYKNQIKNGSVTVFNSSVAVDTTLSIVHRYDGAIAASAGDGEWYKISNVINKDGTGRTSLSVRNEYTVALVEEKGRAVVKVKNKNPYSTEGEIRTYAPLPKDQKRWGVGPYAGVDATGKVSAGAAVSWHLFEW